MGETYSGSVGDETPVLHSTVREFVDSKKIRFGQRIVNVENLGEEVDSLRGVLQSPAALLLETASSVDANGELLAVVATVGEGFDILKVANSPGKKIGAHARRGLKGDDLPAVSGRLSLLDRHVTESNLVDGDLNLKVKGSLEVGLIEAGESSASIAGLKLSAEHVVPFIIERNRGGGGGASNGLVLGAVETGHVVINGALKLDDNRGLAGDRNLLVKCDGGTLGLFIVGEVCRFPALGGLCVIDRNLGTK